MKTLTAATAAEKVKDGVTVVWLLEIDADSPVPDGAADATLYYGSRKYTLSSKNYLDSFTPDGLRLSWERIRVGGGLASVATVDAALRNEALESNASDTYFLEYDEMRIYLSFVTGSEDKDDAVQISRSFIEDTPFSIRSFVLAGIDGTDKAFSTIPREVVNLISHPDAPFDAYGKPLPWVVGAMNVGPHDDAGAFTFLAPCRCTDGFLRKFTAGKRCDAYGAAFQYYPNAKRYGEVVNATQSDSASPETVTITDARRKMRLNPVLPGAANDVTGYTKVFDGDNSTSVAVADGANLDVKISGCPKLGTAVSGLIQINATGAYGYDVLYEGASIFAAAGQSDDTTVTLTNFATDHADSWNFESYEVRIAGSSTAVIKQIYLENTYDDQQTADRQQLSIFQKVTGWEDVTANYTDGAVISSSGSALDNPAHVFGAALRGKGLMERGAAEVDAAAITTAATARAGWSFRFSEDKVIDDITWLNQFGLTAGCHIFMSFEGKWKIVAMDKSRTPQHAFLSASHIAVKNPDDPVPEWEPDLIIGKTPVRDIINEVILRYRKDRGSGEYSGLAMATGRHEETGTCTISASTNRATLTSAPSTNLSLNDVIYPVGGKDYKVTEVVSSTVYGITPVDSGAVVVDMPSAGTYYAGANLSGDFKRSQLRYKTTNPLGEETKDFRKLGGFTSDLIGDSDTADKFIEHLREWRAERRLTVEFATFLNAIDVELGDACFFDHPWLPASKRPPQRGVLSGVENATDTTFHTSSLLWRANDYCLVADKEVVKVTSVSGSTLTVLRGQCNTTAVAHASGATLKRLNMVVWEVTGLRVDVGRAQIRVELQEMPQSYKPVGVVVAAGSPNFSASTIDQRQQSGYAGLLNGRVYELDAYSTPSFVGADTGTY